jgi:hypothetical protein
MTVCRAAVLHRPQIPHHLTGAERFRGTPRQGLAAGGRWAQPAAGVEVVDRGQGVVDRGRGLAADGLGPHPPVAYRAVAGGRVGQRILSSDHTHHISVDDDVLYSLRYRDGTHIAAEHATALCRD